MLGLLGDTRTGPEGQVYYSWYASATSWLASQTASRYIWWNLRREGYRYNIYADRCTRTWIQLADQCTRPGIDTSYDFNRIDLD
ncbi:unnamed protein product [Calypogeia fissa]